MKKVLITGGAGFIGSSLANELSKSSEVTVVDDLSFGNRERLDGGISFRQLNTNDIEKCLSPEFDTIYHLGEYARVEQSFDDIELVFNSNTRPIYNMLKFAQASNAKFIYAGSSTKFAHQTDYEHSPYAISKINNTLLVDLYCTANSIPHAIVYFYNVYGPGESCMGKYATVIGKFIEMRKNGIIDLPVNSPGTQKRNFTHIDDVVSALIEVGLHGEGDGFGIGALEKFSIIDVVQMLGGEVSLKPSQNGNRIDGDLIIDRTLSLGWEPRRSLVEYINSFNL